MSRKVEVFYDGHCPFCVGSRDRIMAIDSQRRIVFRDLNDPASMAAAAPRFDASALADEMHARLPDGTWRIGYFAWVEVLRQLPGCARLAVLLGFPPIAEFGHAAYKLFAANRYLISRLLQLPPPCESTGCAIPVRNSPVLITE